MLDMSSESRVAGLVEFEELELSRRSFEAVNRGEGIDDPFSIRARSCTLVRSTHPSNT